ncbi:hypothetical protein [Clostridium sporogenes]|nr:hypothetical protein [Clostridium sporogenes]MCW6063116.1 hypothetical protein [Clostridium sporogenes]MCW6068293.1 hypothetical protein [Clostridium sporogenes]MCW6084569.1 hypothetical protein [Clostridium sporogenes]MCW6087873.1 hypothetical protein [Clostridium sporogenes]
MTIAPTLGLGLTFPSPFLANFKAFPI